MALFQNKRKLTIEGACALLTVYTRTQAHAQMHTRTQAQTHIQENPRLLQVSHVFEKQSLIY